MKPKTPKETKKERAGSDGTGKLGGVTGKGFMPGQSGNPNGRPRTAKFSEAAKNLAASAHAKTGETHAEFLVRMAFERATRGKGNVEWAKLFIAYAEGKPLQSQINYNVEP